MSAPTTTNELNAQSKSDAAPATSNAAFSGASSVTAGMRFAGSTLSVLLMIAPDHRGRRERSDEGQSAHEVA